MPAKQGKERELPPVPLGVAVRLRWLPSFEWREMFLTLNDGTQLSLSRATGARTFLTWSQASSFLCRPRARVPRTGDLGPPECPLHRAASWQLPGARTTGARPGRAEPLRVKGDPRAEIPKGARFRLLPHCSQGERQLSCLLRPACPSVMAGLGVLLLLAGGSAAHAFVLGAKPGTERLRGLRTKG